jgi:hypothetical protein
MLRHVALVRTDDSGERIANVVPISPLLLILMMEAIYSSKTSVLTRATHRDIPEDGILWETYNLPMRMSLISCRLMGLNLCFCIKFLTWIERDFCLDLWLLACRLWHSNGCQYFWRNSCYHLQDKFPSKRWYPFNKIRGVTPQRAIILSCILNHQSKKMTSWPSVFVLCCCGFVLCCRGFVLCLYFVCVLLVCCIVVLLTPGWSQLQINIYIYIYTYNCGSAYWETRGFYWPDYLPEMTSVNMKESITYDK